jgi:integrase
MRLTKRGSTWWVDFRLPDGRRRRLSTSETDRARAEKTAAGIVADAMRGGTVVTLGDALARTFKEHWDGTKSAHVIRHTVNVLTRDIGDWPLRDCTYAALRGYCERLKNDGLKPATINRRMSAVGVTLRDCARRGECERPDMPHFTENNKRERYMTLEEERAVLAWLDRKVASDRILGPAREWEFVRALFIVLLDTGMRFSEAFIAVEQSAGVLHLKHGDTKSGKARSIPLTGRALLAWATIIDSPWYVTLKTDANAWAWVDHRWKQAAAGGGCADVTLHILRHTCASRLVQRGVDIFTVSKWLGHSSVKVTERYSHLAPDVLSRALSALEQRPVPVAEASCATQSLQSRDELYPPVAHTERAGG